MSAWPLRLKHSAGSPDGYAPAHSLAKQQNAPLPGRSLVRWIAPEALRRHAVLEAFRELIGKGFRRFDQIPDNSEHRGEFRFALERQLRDFSGLRKLQRHPIENIVHVALGVCRWLGHDTLSRTEAPASTIRRAIMPVRSPNMIQSMDWP